MTEVEGQKIKLRKYGKKHQEWIKARAKLIKDAVVSGRFIIDHGYPEGICADCRQWHPLEPDHNIKRSQGGAHTKDNIEWVCRNCHAARDERGDPMKKKKGNKKPKWMTKHECKECKAITASYLCHRCGKVSV